jgi:hypothetical protein
MLHVLSRKSQERQEPCSIVGCSVGFNSEEKMKRERLEGPEFRFSSKEADTDESGSVG